MEKKKNGLLGGAIDVLIFAYTVSIFILSFDEDLNKYSKLLAFALMGLLAVYALANMSIKINSVVLCFMGFTAFGYLSYFWAVDKSETLAKSFTMLQLFVLFWLLYNYLSCEDKVETLIKTLAWSGVILAVYVLITNGFEGYISGLQSGDRMGLEGANENSVGLTAGFSALISLWYAICRKKYGYFIFAALLVFVALGTGSRKVLIMLAIGIVAMFLLNGNKKKRFIAVLQCAAVLLIIYGVLQLPIFNVITERFDSMITILQGGSSNEGSMQTRMEMISIGWEQFCKTPLWGIGLNNSSVLTGQAIGWAVYLHNNYIELLACVGLIGFILYYAMYLIPAKNLVKASFKGRDIAILALVLLIVNIILQFGFVSYYDKSIYLLVLVFALVAERVEKE